MTPPTWSGVLDGLAAQLDLQERCIRNGHPAPEPLRLETPEERIDHDQRLRAIALFERGEELALEAAKAMGQAPQRLARAYGVEGRSVRSTTSTRT